jgi:phenylacetate-CoA ligase
MQTAYFDDLEIRSPEQREGELMARLPQQIAHAKQSAPAYAELLAAVDPRDIASRKALAQLPVTRKSELKQHQARRPPFGGYAARAPGEMAKLFQSPGPIYEPESRREDYWRCARALFAAGLRAGDIVHNTFSYHLTPAGSMLESGALALGCAVIPAGVGQTELQLQAIADLRPSAYTGTPSFLRVLLEKAAESGGDIASLRRAVVSGEALPPSLREWFAERGIVCAQLFGTADLGTIAYESVLADGTVNPGMIVDESLILELVYPGTGEPVPDGEIGEMVVTTLNPDYPLVRFATGDLTAVLPGTSPCGRTNVRIRGWLGRADQTTKVRGMFVHPSQVADILRRHPEVGTARLVVRGEMANDEMVLRCETEQPQAQGLAARIEASIREVTKLRGTAELVAPGTLPRDGRLIEDARSYR